MKHASLLIVLCALLGLSASAQSTTTVEKSKSRITITTKKTDENGKTVTETYIAEGEEPGEILQGMAINPEIIQRVDISTTGPEEGERLFLFRQAGDKMAIEGRLNEKIVKEIDADGNEVEKVIIINREDGSGKECFKFMSPRGSVGHGWSQGFDSKSNCAALGVYVHNAGDQGGSRISSLIENGGAKAAGLQEGDIITRIEEFEVNDFATLHLALAHFKPGDVVSVRYEREGKSLNAKTELKDWRDLPGHEWRSRNDCGPETVIKEENTESLRDEPGGGVSNIQPLELTDARIFPNPTEGVFEFSFSTVPGPLSISVTDVNGKVMYSENNDNPDGVYQREIDLKGVPLGNYVITVTQGDKVFTHQISKQ